MDFIKDFYRMILNLVASILGIFGADTSAVEKLLEQLDATTEDEGNE